MSPQRESESTGPRPALGSRLEAHREQLRHTVDYRLDRRLRSRIDPSDVVQDTFLEASARMGEYAKKPPMPFFVWLRFLAAQRVRQLHRQHLRAEARDVRREVPFGRLGFSGSSSRVIARQLAGSRRSPSGVVMQRETEERLHDALEEMDPLDREMLVLRHFERLSNREAAQVLEIRESTASTRHVRALARLRGILEGHQGSL